MSRITYGLIGAVVGVVGAVSTVYIQNNRGGVVTEFVRQYDALAAQGRHVVVEGDCASSCTIALGYPNMCFDRNASLRFHPAYTPILFGLFGYVINQDANHLMLDHYPADARVVIDRHGDLTRNPGGWFYPRLFTIPASEFPRHYLCN